MYEERARSQFAGDRENRQAWASAARGRGDRSIFVTGRLTLVSYPGSVDPHGVSWPGLAVQLMNEQFLPLQPERTTYRFKSVGRS